MNFISRVGIGELALGVAVSEVRGKLVVEYGTTIRIADIAIYLRPFCKANIRI
jgi:hypothetical protein